MSSEALSLGQPEAIEEEREIQAMLNGLGLKQADVSVSEIDQITMDKPEELLATSLALEANDAPWQIAEARVFETAMVEVQRAKADADTSSESETLIRQNCDAERSEPPYPAEMTEHEIPTHRGDDGEQSAHG